MTINGQIRRLSTPIAGDVGDKVIPIDQTYDPTSPHAQSGTAVAQAVSSASAVSSVNGQTGAVVLDAEDVGALPDDTLIPTKTSDLTNDSGFLTEHQSLSAYRTSANQDTIDSGKVDKVTGKGLSTEDYSTAEKTSVASIPSIADRVTTIEGKESGWDGKSVVSGTNDGTNWTELTINGVSKAISQGGGSQHLYKHCIRFWFSGYDSSFNTIYGYMHLQVLNNNATPFTLSTFQTYCLNNTADYMIFDTGTYVVDASRNHHFATCVSKSGSRNVLVDYGENGNTINWEINDASATHFINDNVTQVI